MNPPDQLKDIHLPEQVSAWPPAYGWWILALLALCLLVVTFIWLRNRHRQLQAKRDAHAIMTSLDVSNPEWNVALNELFKRTCMSYFTQEEIASQYGPKWLQFLAMQLPKKHQDNFITTLTPWSDSLYKGNASGLDFDAIKHQSLLWLQSFKPPKSQASNQEGHHV